MYKGVIPFIGLQLLALFIVGTNPGLVNYLPNRVSLTSETAPPPLNPRLQYCMEEYVVEQFAENGDALRRAIATARGLDYNYLPSDLREGIVAGFDKAESSFGLIAAAKAAEAEIEANSEAYRPLHRQVRDIENAMRLIGLEIKGLEKDIKRAGADDARKAAREARIAALTAEREELEATIPAEWEAAHEAFLDLTKAERKARTTYRRATDDAYEPVVELIAIIAAMGPLEGLRDGLTALQAEVPGMEFDAAIERIKADESRVGKVAGTKGIKKLLSKARRAIKGKNPDPEKAAEFLAEAIAAFEEDLAWRRRADAELKAGLAAYDAAIRDTIGLRGQRKLPTEQALYVAACGAGHRDISLSF
jgi:hypothetical protein